jgi:arylamine N-acetyltransferase
MIDALRAILDEFRAIPYENLSKIVRHEERGAVLESADEILRDHRRRGTGGTCFSIVNALHETLRDAGVPSRFHLADRHYGRDTHCALVADVDGRQWLLDPGFLVFEPVPFPEGRAAAPGGSIVWEPRADRVEAATLYPNGHRKARYSLKPVPAGRDEFLAAWRRSFEFEMMRTPVITYLESGRHVYLRDGHLRIDGRYIGRLDLRGIEEWAERSGIERELTRRALDIVGSR